MNEEDEMETLTKLWAATDWPVGSTFKTTVDGQPAVGVVVDDYTDEALQPEPCAVAKYAAQPSVRLACVYRATPLDVLPHDIVDVEVASVTRIQRGAFDEGVRLARAGVLSGGVIEPLPPGEPQR